MAKAKKTESETSAAKPATAKATAEKPVAKSTAKPAVEKSAAAKTVAAKPAAAPPVAAHHAAAKPVAAKPVAPVKKSSKAKQPTMPHTPSLIDTSMAAESAAKMIGSKWNIGGSGGTAPKESASFRQLKEGLNKPASTTMANLLDKAGGPEQKKQNLPFGGPKQVGRNQTFGADVNRAGVPRRTGGG